MPTPRPEPGCGPARDIPEADHLLKFRCVALFVSLVLLSVAGLLAQSPELEKTAQKARDLIAAGKPEDAIPLYQELVRAFPRDPGMIMNLSVAQFLAKRYPDAIEQAQAALRLEPGLLSASLFLGAGYIELGEPARAIEPLQKVVEAQPNERNARLLLGEALLALQRYEDAAEQLQKASELAPENPKVWYGLGQSWEALSERACQQLEKAGPQSVYFLSLAAEASLKQGRYGRALRYYHEALSKLPALRGVHTGLSALYRKTGHSDRAAAEEESERKIAPPDCRSKKPECDFMEGRYRAVVEAGQREQTPEAWYWTSKAYAELARQAYERLAQLPASAESRLRAAKTYDTRGLYAEAAKEYREALKFDPGNPRTQTALAWSLYRSRDYQAALPLLKGLLDRNPLSAELNFLYGGSLLNLEQPEAAIPYLQAALKEDAHFPPAHAALGHASLRAGRAEQAIPHLKIALPTDEDGSIHFQLLRAYQLTNQAELAKAALLDYQTFRKSKDQKKRSDEDYPQ